VSIYVDQLRPCKSSQAWPYSRACHLIADDVQELHTFAIGLGLKRWWFHGDHYDLTARMQDKAIKAGAHLVQDRKAFVAKERALRAAIDAGKAASREVR
jgi:hypothetical protein